MPSCRLCFPGCLQRWGQVAAVPVSHQRDPLSLDLPSSFPCECAGMQMAPEETTRVVKVTLKMTEAHDRRNHLHEYHLEECYCA